jgi:hypothetical protein
VASIKLDSSTSIEPAKSYAVPWSTEVLMNGKTSDMLVTVPNQIVFITGNPWS